MTGQTWLGLGLAFVAVFTAFHALVRRVTARRNELFAAMAARHDGKVVTTATWREARCAIALDHGGRAVTITEGLTVGGGRGYDTDLAFEAAEVEGLRFALRRRSKEVRDLLLSSELTYDWEVGCCSVVPSSPFLISLLLLRMVTMLCSLGLGKVVGTMIFSWFYFIV